MKFFPCLFIALACFQAAFAQSAAISPRKIVYFRSNPASADKARVTVVYPKVRTANAVLSRRIENAIGFAQLTGLNTRRGVDDDQWLESAEYTVDYNKKGVLSITVSMSGTGAFSSTLSRSVVVDLKTGRRITAGKAFRDLPGLAALVRSYQREEIEQTKKEIASQSDYPADFVNRFLDTAELTAQNLHEFSVGEEGVTFIYDYGFPRIIRPVQPAGVFLVPWRELKAFIPRGGLLGKFVY